VIRFVSNFVDMHEPT